MDISKRRICIENLKPVEEIKAELKKIKLLKVFRKLTDEETQAFYNLLALQQLHCMEAKDRAFEEAGLDEGRLKFVCPICGRMADGVRFKFNGRYSGMGTGCDCGWLST